MRWIWIRGLVREKGHWYQLPERFHERFPDAEVQFLDLPGNGARFREKTPVSVPLMARSLSDEFRRLRWSSPDGEPTYLLAMSLGAMVAYEWLIRRPTDFDGAVLTNTSFRGLSPMLKRIRPQNLPPMLKAAAVSDLVQRERQILAITSNRTDVHEEAAEVYAGFARERPVARENLLRQVLAGARYRIPDEKPSVPLLVLVSRKDSLVDPQCSRDLQRYVSASFAEHPWGNHDLALDDPQWMVDRIADWLERAPSVADFQ
ncbi:MAG: alpha/beta hydrolase [Myxococcales bacterium]|nr:alpha/beta hydrolase [Myxococcales bacterium]